MKKILLVINQESLRGFLLGNLILAIVLNLQGIAYAQQRLAERIVQQAGTLAGSIMQEVEALPRIGYEAFKIDVSKIPAGAIDKNYILSPRDKIILKVWGRLQLTYTLIVTDDQYIEIPDVPGRIYVHGLTLGQLEDRVRQQLASVYSSQFNLEQPSAATAYLDLGLAEIHDLQFLVQGEVVTPGSYSLHPSRANIIYALASAGGIKDSGSLRHIKIRRGNQLINFDFYDFLIRGNILPSQSQIQNNDVIFIPMKRKEVRIRGEIKRPGAYELQENASEDLEALLDMAGGVKPTASLQKVLILRAQIDEGFKTRDVNLNEMRRQSQKFLLQDQDIVTVFPFNQQRIDYVSIRGSGVAVPHDFEFKPGMRINDLIAAGGGLMRDAYLERADLVRTQPDMRKTYRQINLRLATTGSEDQNVVLQPLDALITYNARDIEGDQKYLSLIGHVKSPGRYEYYRGMSLYDLLFSRGGFQDKDFLRETYLERGDIVRSAGGAGRRELIKFHVGKLMEGDPAQNIELQSEDEVVIYSQAQIVGEEQFVTLSGYAKNPGQHRLYQGMRLFDLLYTVGGYQDLDFRRQAFLPRGDVIRSVKRDGQVLEEILRFDLGALFNGDAKQNLDLQNGDQVIVYSAASFQGARTIEISGMVRLPGRYTWSSNMTLADLLLQSGGLLEGAVGSRAEVVRLDASSRDGPRTQTLSVNLQSNFYNQEQVTSFQLQNGDKVFVRRNPAFEEQRSVEVIGEVVYPGHYVLEKRETRISEIIQKAGGIKPGGFVEGAVLLRNHAVSAPNRSTTRVVLDLKQAIENPGSDFDFVLQDADKLEIPRFENVVRIEGAVNNPISVAFQPGRKLNEYLSMAGGLMADADAKSILVIGPNGAGIGRKSAFLGWWGGLSIRPGTVISVPKLTTVK